MKSTSLPPVTLFSALLGSDELLKPMHKRRNWALCVHVNSAGDHNCTVLSSSVCADLKYTADGKLSHIHFPDCTQQNQNTIALNDIKIYTAFSQY